MIPPLAEVGYYEPWWIQILKGLVIFVAVFQLVPVVLLAERKILGRMQHRYGPNRVGPFGLLQPIADAIKSIFKEDIVVSASDPRARSAGCSPSRPQSRCSRRSPRWR